MSSPFAPLWGLDPNVAYLNHGSFGACPSQVLERQTALRRELEAEPMDFLSRTGEARLGRARAVLGAFVDADPDDLAFVTNATSGVNTVLRSLRFEPGDELLTTDHAYGACRRTLDYVARWSGAQVVTARVPFPLRSRDELVAAVLAAVTPRTRLALLDHITSPTALVFPLDRLVPELEARGIETLIDGAHALGQIEIGLRGLQPSYYTANAHKWLCAPKGSAFLFVRRDRQSRIHPLTLSHAYDAAHDGELFRAEFDWTGTSDPTAWLAIPDCLSLLGGLFPGGWRELMACNHRLALDARAALLSALQVEPPCPDELLGAMASIPLPAAAAGAPADGLSAAQLHDWIRARGVESWCCRWYDGQLLRASAQLYNDLGQFERLAGLVREALGH